MRNPYDVLGIPSSATVEQVKDAYRKLSADYQSDKYSPEISSRKMDEINEAYDNIIYSRENSNSTYSSSDNSYNNSAQYSNDYTDIRAKINEGRIDDAEIRLDGISPTQRNAEWYFLKGTVNHKRGWFEEAKKNFTVACQMEPSNAEYRNAFASLNNNFTSGGYRTKQRSANTEKSDCGVCDICSALLCADCCCECFGGDLIPCC